MKPERQSISLFIFLVGMVLLSTGILLITSTEARAQEAVNNQYAGISDCNDCHMSVDHDWEITAHALTMFEVEDSPDAVIADFSVGEDLRQYTFADESENRAFTLEDVTYAIGTGKIAQRYLVQVAEDDYRVLPAEWNVERNEWQALNLEDDSWNTNCATCHTTGYDEATNTWVDEAVTCEACHGPGMAHVDAADEAPRSPDEDELAVITSAIVTNPETSTCGNCHTSYTEGDTCTDSIHCDNDVYHNWESSPHGQMVSNEETGESEAALTCDGCHAMHPEDETGFPHLLSISPEGLCSSCHENNADDMLSGAQFVDNIDGVPSAHYEEGLTCESCHNAHAISAIPQNNTVQAVCNDCHGDLTATALNTFADGANDKIDSRLANINAVISDETDDWVETVVNVIESDTSDGLHNYSYISRMLDTVEANLGLSTATVMSNIPIVNADDPTECAECHTEEHSTWQTSPHANASLGENFQRVYAEKGQPSYCMSCHASGFDPNTQTYVFEGVVCSSCHIMENGEHPPSPMPVADNSEVCGRCHSGEHAPEFNEWLVSDHSDFNVDCVDCHTPHNNGLRLEDVNTTCADCHEDAMNDEVHMGEDMTCVDCHMTHPVTDPDTGEQMIHHTMIPDPGTCSDCHGDIHTLTKDPTRNLDAEGQEMLTTLEEEVSSLETKADTNLQSGIVGGAVGALVLVGFLLLALRLGRMK